MGSICSSCESTSVATAKLIMQDGQLQEFPYPVKVSQVLQKYPSCFICNSDDLYFDDYVKAIENDEQLYPGQLYFALPMSRLKHPLHAHEMAELAVKASLALMKSGSCLKGFKPIPVEYADKESVKSSRQLVPTVVSAGGVAKRRCSRGGGRRSRFSPNLVAIEE